MFSDGQTVETLIFSYLDTSKQKLNLSQKCFAYIQLFSLNGMAVPMINYLPIYVYRENRYLKKKEWIFVRTVNI